MGDSLHFGTICLGHTGNFSRNKLELYSWPLRYPYLPTYLSIYLSTCLGTEYFFEISYKSPMGKGSKGTYVSLEMFSFLPFS